ncbi:MAG: M4 family metallopeptidase [Thermoanaerobaculales bacterium]
MRRGVCVLLVLVCAAAASAAGPGDPAMQPLTASQLSAISALPRVDLVQIDKRGTPAFLAGRLGVLEEAAWADAAPNFLKRSGAIFGLSGGEDFRVDQVMEDNLGQVHVRMQQSWRGLPVIGADIVVHADRSTREVAAISGSAVPMDGVATEALVDADKAIGLALEEAGIDGTALGEPELVYVIGSDGKVHLAWSIDVAWESHDGPELDTVFADAVDASLAARHPRVHRAKNRRIYSANNGSSLPGTLLFTEGGSSSDQVAMGAYDNSGLTYDYYWQKFSRDSYNDAGATLTSTVHYQSNYNNAFWNGSQMVYGDGDGTTFSPFSEAFDVVAHELTHAVTDTTANLLYQKESGALNEALSDILAAAGEAWRDGGITSTTWLIGEDCYTPGTAGDALRYMDNPTADGYSVDYYPERLYPDPCTPNQNTNDLCGVHGNSGIANLAFVLLARGGTHPRGKTSVTVPAIGVSKAEQIFYRALTVYMTSSTNFEGARNATAQAAQDLYGSTDVNAVHATWDAVGVPGGAVSVTALSNGVPVSGLSGATGNEQYFVLAVPTGASDLSFQISGGSGDADLYVRSGSLPTTSAYDCRPYLNGNSETCSFASPTAGDWYVMIQAYSTYSSVSLTGSFLTSVPNQPPTANFSFTTSDLTATFSDSSSDSDGSIVSRSWTFGDGGTSTATNPSHTYGSAATYTVNLTVTDNDGATNSISKQVTVTAPAGGGAPCTNCTEYTGTLTGTGDVDYQPNGTYYYAGSGVHEGWLEGPAGTDFDLYLYRWTGFSWSRVASSTSSTSSEHIAYSGSSGYYYWRVYSYSGSGSYQLWLATP